MSFSPQHIVETQDGVYRPPPLQLEVSFLAIALLVVGVGFALGRLSLAYASLYAAILVVPGAIRIHGYRKFGPLGRPCVAVIGGALVLDRPGDTRGALSFALNELQQLMVYGVVGRRIYRFVRHDGTYVETVPMWGRSVEKSVLEFLQRALPNTVTVAEPQTLFASIRGDEP